MLALRLVAAGYFVWVVCDVLWAVVFDLVGGGWLFDLGVGSWCFVMRCYVSGDFITVVCVVVLGAILLAVSGLADLDLRVWMVCIGVLWLLIAFGLVLGWFC